MATAKRVENVHVNLKCKEKLNNQTNITNKCMEIKQCNWHHANVQ